MFEHVFCRCASYVGYLRRSAQTLWLYEYGCVYVSTFQKGMIHVHTREYPWLQLNEREYKLFCFSINYPITGLSRKNTSDKQHIIHCFYDCLKQTRFWGSKDLIMWPTKFIFAITFLNCSLFLNIRLIQLCMKCFTPPVPCTNSPGYKIGKTSSRLTGLQSQAGASWITKATPYTTRGSTTLALSYSMG